MSVAVEPYWISLVRRERATRTLQSIADQCGVKRTALSQVLNGCGNYGLGVCSTAHMEEKVLLALDRVECPFLTAHSGQPVKIERSRCIEQSTKAQPVGSALAVRHWEACRTCPKRVKN